ncbi:MAG TPA: hemerythrin domain-containing protein [Pseudonocardia sp.]|nr:hemerythrin domain-containing protein [Pseudonocardia sp.]
MPSPGQNHGNRLATEMVGDHRAAEAIFHRLETDATEPAQRQELVEQVVTQLVTHTVAAEQLLYPAARKALADGDEVADRHIAMNNEAERAMKELERHDPGDPEFEALLSRVIAAARLHAQDEERTLLPRLAVAVGLDATNATGDAIAAAKKTAPTRPHPAAPDTPPGNLANPLTGLVDRLRDTLSGRNS